MTTSVLLYSTLFLLSFFFGYLYLIFALNKILLRNFDQLIVLILIVSISTAPLLFNFAFRIEHSLWGSIAITLILIELITSNKINYVRAVSFVSIFSMMRMPVFILVFPLVTHFFFYEFKNWSKSNRKKEFKKLFLILSPIAIFLPFLINFSVFRVRILSKMADFQRLSAAMRPIVISFSF